LLSFSRFEDIKAAVSSTFCSRRQWITDDKPLLVDILQQYPKFQSCAQLVFISFIISVEYDLVCWCSISHLSILFSVCDVEDIYGFQSVDSTVRGKFMRLMN
jgi:hypothetical protein